MFLLSAAHAAIYVDAVNGSDVGGDGSAGNPYQSLGHVLPMLSGGEEVILADGNYGNISLNKGGDLFSDWVVIRAAEGSAPELGSITVGGPSGPSDQTGGYNAYLRMEGLVIRDGVLVNGGKHWAVVDCLVERIGPWTGSVENIEKVAISFRNGTDILIEGTEVTNTGVAIAGRGHDVVIRDCHLHDCSHDGIRVIGLWNSLIENNRIYRFDDGVADAEADWSRHCDLIHIFIPGPGNPGMENHNVVIRNNVLYDAESQGIQFNNYYASSERNTNITIENNIFGPTKANVVNVADPVDGLVFRHNTVIHFPGGRTFGRWLLDNHNVRIGNSTGVQVYNNIFHTLALDSRAEVELFNWNLIVQPTNPRPAGVDDSRSYGRFIITGVDPGFVDPAAFDGALRPDSPAVNAGTAYFAPTPVPETDIAGTPRDAVPDLGAWELPEQSPDPEPVPQEVIDLKTVFVDDFEDGHYKDVDPWLNQPHQQGLSWHYPEGASFKFFVQDADSIDRNALFPPLGVAGEGRIAWLFTDQGADWAEYDLRFRAFNAYLTQGSGPVVLAIDQDNCYWFDIGRDAGNLVRIMGGTAETLAGDADLRMPHNGIKSFRISVRRVATGIAFAVDSGDDGVVDFNYIDSDPGALATFTSGGIGVHDDNDQVHLKIVYDDFRVELVNHLGWIWSDQLRRYVYVDAPPSGSGGWLYLYK